MFVDLLGKTRVKLGLHIHTTLSDGHCTPEEAAQYYLEAGYDAVALTDHWIYHGEDEIEGLHILPGIEYNVGGNDTRNGVFHIVGIGMTSDPGVPADWVNMVKTSEAKAAEIMKKIHLHNGIAVLAHPAWSLNTPEMLSRIGDFDALEIYNTVSECGMSDRPYSGLIADSLANLGRQVPLIAADDTHYYQDDLCRAAIMVEATDMETQSLLRAIKAGKFYATQGPELHLTQLTPDKVKVICSPCSKIAFFSNNAWSQGRVIKGENLVQAEYSRYGDEDFVRAEVTDAEGRMAWSGYLPLGK